MATVEIPTQVVNNNFYYSSDYSPYYGLNPGELVTLVRESPPARPGLLAAEVGAP